jgi:hypothetical protein
MAAPSVYAAINAVTADLARSGIAKTRINEADDYQYRSIDDVLDRLAPLLADKRLCVLPQVVERSVTDRTDEAAQLLSHVVIRMRFKLVSVEDGSSHCVEAYGEGLDPSDKATAKAMSAAYKSAMVQTFCIPIGGSDDPDRGSPRLSARTHSPEPVQGWEQWARDIEDVVSVCESEAAINLVQERNRELLKSLSRERPELYRELGEAFSVRREGLQQHARQPTPKKRVSAAARSKKEARSGERVTEHD